MSMSRDGTKKWDAKQEEKSANEKSPLFTFELKHKINRLRFYQLRDHGRSEDLHGLEEKKHKNYWAYSK